MSFSSPEETMYLDMTSKKALAHLNGIQSIKFDKFVVGVAIINSDNEILLLKRRPDEKHYPNVYEMPGGKLDPSDTTVRRAIAREVQEETGLQVTGVVRSLPSIHYTTQSQCGYRRAIQLSYVVRVKDTEFEVNPREHTRGVWANRALLSHLQITDAMKILVLQALDSN